MTTTPTGNLGAQKIMRYAKAHIAVIGAIIGVLLQFFADTEPVHEYGALIVGLLTALGVYVVPNAPSSPAEAPMGGMASTDVEKS